MPSRRAFQSVRNQSPRRRFTQSALAETLESRTLLTTFVVNTTSDSSNPPANKMTLRAAITAANNATSSPSKITFDPSVFSNIQTITLAGTVLQLTNTKQSITITGPTLGVTLSGNTKSGVFRVSQNVHASIGDMTITAGTGSLINNFNNGGGINCLGDLNLNNVTLYKNGTSATDSAGGINNSGTMNLNNVLISQNNSVTYGGGIANDGTMTITNSTLSGNVSSGGGAIANFGAMTLTNVTISGNHATEGGGIDSNEFNDQGSMNLNNVTISGNSAVDDGGGLYIFDAKNTLANTIIAGNTTVQQKPDVAGAVNSLGNNLIGETDGSSGWKSSDLTGTIAHPLNPKLGSLTNNGGAIQATMVPQSGSPAINAGKNSLIPSGITTDERGFSRTYGGTVDIGAVETQPVIDAYAPVTFTGIPYSATVDAGVSTALQIGEFLAISTTVPYTVDVKWGDGSADTKFTGTPNTLFMGTQNHTYKNTGGYTLSFSVTDAKGIKSNTASYLVTVVSPQGNTGYLFKGTVFLDANKNGKKDSTEKGLAGWEVWADLNKDSKLDTGDKTAFTDASGNYTLGLLGTSGSYTLHEVMPTHWSQTTPSANKGITLTLSTSSTKTGLNFGDYTAIKYLSTVATTSGIVAWWTFDSSSQANSILNGYTGSLKGGAKISTSAGAPIHGESSSSGLSLNGTSAYVNTNLTTQQQFNTAGTYNTWIDLGSTPAKSGHYYVIVAKSVFGNDLDLQIQTDGSVHFYTDNGTSTSFKPSSLTGWHMITAEFDTKAKIRKIFWDGKQVASTSPYTGTHFANTGTFAIGESDVFTGRFLDGKIDEVSLFNDALTSTQITAIYNAANA